jgi:5'-nucleotidase
MRILLTNDDGIHAPGLRALLAAFSERHQIVVVAPDRERSAVGHGITLHEPIRLHAVRFDGTHEAFAVTGTPADCVKLGLAELVDGVPDLVVSGINPGANVGININYSGTVAAAKEAAMAGIPALAVSIMAPGHEHLDAAAQFTASLAARAAQWPLAAGTFLNVNFPDMPLSAVREVRWCRQGNGVFAQHFEKRRDPRDRTYYWQGCDRQAGYRRPDIDGSALADRCITITPIKCDMTDYDALDLLSRRHIPLTP